MERIVGCGMSIYINNVTKVIGQKKILKGINLKISTGEIVGLIGPNGAGKTTLMKLICGLSDITSGYITLDNFRIKKDTSTICNKIGVLLENTSAYGWLSGYENLMILANMYEQISKDHINEIIKITGLEKGIHEKFSSYSLGMKQRLGIAFALLNNPSIIILDEPTNGLDVDGVRDIRRLVKYLSRELNTTILISSHILAEMDKMCDKAAFIKGGKLMKVVNSKELSNGGFEEIYFGLNKIEFS